MQLLWFLCGFGGGSRSILARWPPDTLRCAQDLGSRDSTLGVRFPGLAVLAGGIIATAP